MCVCVYVCVNENRENWEQGLASLLKLKHALKHTDVAAKMLTKMEKVFAFQRHYGLIYVLYIAGQCCFAASIIQ